MQSREELSRRSILLAGSQTATAVAILAGAGAEALAAPDTRTALKDYDPIRTELVMDLVVTCSSPEKMAPSSASKDGNRDSIWPIIGGRFQGSGISGTVIPGGGDFPVERPDGAVVIDALYRLKTTDGVTIIIHNRGLGYSNDKYRLVPEFIAPVGKYDWLNKSIFLCTLVDPVPTHMALAKGPNENDRLLQVHRVL